MISEVIKRDGSVEPFQPEKLNKWAEYAQVVGTNWSDIAFQTARRLTNPAKTEDIHQAMIDACIQKKDLAHSRMGARLLAGGIRKNMDYILGVNDESPLESILEAFEDFDLWDSDTIPPYNTRWQKWYNEMCTIPLEYWQLKQWEDKYACKVQGNVVETPYLGYLGIALALFGDTLEAKQYAIALTKGQINLPTPALNGLRNGDWDTISCCVISAVDNTDSIGVANYIAYRMTAKKAGIGIEYTTRSKHDKVKKGRVAHLGKHPIYKNCNTNVKVLTQITRGGNATVTVYACDPEIQEVIGWKGQKVDIKTRIDTLDYSFGYNDAFVDAVKKNLDWHMFSVADAPDLVTGKCIYMLGSIDEYNAYVQSLIAAGVKHTTVKARALCARYVTTREETGRFYDINLNRVNRHTPFLTRKGDVIRQSNLCLEINLPTKGYPSMYDLVATEKSEGETAFCSLSAINYFKTSLDELEQIAYLTLKAIDTMIRRAPMMTPSMKESIMRRKSVGVGITGLASAMYRAGFDYDGSEASLNFVRTIAEHHYFYLLKASQKIAKQTGEAVEGIDLGWLPIDTAIAMPITGLPWELLRNKPRAHSVLVAHMPTESSALLSGASNGVYPVREKIVTKQSRKGYVQFICEDFDPTKHKTAYEIDNIILSRYYSAIQDNSDQAISCDSYENPDNYPGGKIPVSKLIREFVAHASLGNKTRYYKNTDDSNGGTMQEQMSTVESVLTLEDLGIELDGPEGCESCKL